MSRLFHGCRSCIYTWRHLQFDKLQTITGAGVNVALPICALLYVEVGLWMSLPSMESCLIWWMATSSLIRDAAIFILHRIACVCVCEETIPRWSLHQNRKMIMFVFNLRLGTHLLLFDIPFNRDYVVLSKELTFLLISMQTFIIRLHCSRLPH